MTQLAEKKLVTNVEYIDKSFSPPFNEKKFC